MHALTPIAQRSGFTKDPTWLPHIFDGRADTLTFAHLPREAQRKLTFLDQRFVPREACSPAVAVADLPADSIRRSAGPLHFVFHTGFCCSTLLARALDMPGVSMGLKEPAVLTGFADHLPSRRRSVGALEALSVTLNLLSRPLEGGEAQIVKPSTAVNSIIPELLHTRPDAKAIVLFSTLDTFLRAVIRRGLAGRMFAREMCQQLARVSPLDTGVPDEFAVLQVDLQVAANAWLMQSTILDAIATRFGRDRVRVVSGDRFLAEPGAVLSAIGAFFALELTPERIADVLQSGVFEEHAKELGRPFNAKAQRAQHDEAGTRFAEDLALAHDWARRIAVRCNAPLTLRETIEV